MWVFIAQAIFVVAQAAVVAAASAIKDNCKN